MTKFSSLIVLCIFAALINIHKQVCSSNRCCLRRWSVVQYIPRITDPVQAVLFVFVFWWWQLLTHWGRVTHICVSKLTIIGSDNGLSPDRRQAIIWTNAGISLIRTSGTNFSESLSEIRAFSFKKMHLKMSSAKWRRFCLGLNVLRLYHWNWSNYMIV